MTTSFLSYGNFAPLPRKRPCYNVRSVSLINPMNPQNRLYPEQQVFYPQKGDWVFKVVYDNVSVSERCCQRKEVYHYCANYVKQHPSSSSSSSLLRESHQNNRSPPPKIHFQFIGVLSKTPAILSPYHNTSTQTITASIYVPTDPSKGYTIVFTSSSQRMIKKGDLLRLMMPRPRNNEDDNRTKKKLLVERCPNETMEVLRKTTEKNLSDVKDVREVETSLKDIDEWIFAISKSNDTRSGDVGTMNIFKQ